MLGGKYNRAVSTNNPCISTPTGPNVLLQDATDDNLTHHSQTWRLLKKMNLNDGIKTVS